MSLCRRAIPILLALFVFFASVSPAHAIDKRLKLMFKTAGYGAAAGFVAGGASWALGLGGARNAMIGASLGLYAGILLAGYVVATADEGEVRQGPKNPFEPREPVGPEDWESEPQDEEGSTRRTPAPVLVRHWDRTELSGQRLDAGAAGGAAVWTPVVSWVF